jgi:DNA-binding transcriptional LysR family regulator
MGNPALEVTPLARASIACVMPEDHPLAARPSVAIADLADTPVITYLPQALLRPYIDRACEDAGVKLQIRVETGLSVTGIMLAFHGAGIALVEPDLLASLALPGLVSRPLNPAIELQSVLLRHRARPPSRLLSAFIEYMYDELRRTPAQD